MRIIKLGKRPIIKFEKRVTGGPENLNYHWHLIIFGWHICPLPKDETYPQGPIALFQGLCRK